MSIEQNSLNSLTFQFKPMLLSIALKLALSNWIAVIFHCCSRTIAGFWESRAPIDGECSQKPRCLYKTIQICLCNMLVATSARTNKSLISKINILYWSNSKLWCPIIWFAYCSKTGMQMRNCPMAKQTKTLAAAEKKRRNLIWVNIRPQYLSASVVHERS